MREKEGHALAETGGEVDGQTDSDHEKWQTFQQGDVCGWCGGLEKAAALIRALLPEKPSPKCEWRQGTGIEETVWFTQCGEAFQFEVGGPVENKSKFCSYCGKKLVIAPEPPVDKE